MSEQIISILKELRRDHRNMAFLLDLLEAEVNLIRAERTPDYALLHDIMHYMTLYPDAVHHPKEDRLYDELRTVRPDLTSGFERISLDHRALAEQGKQLRDDFAAVDAGEVVDRTSLITEAQRYVNTLRSHMQWEEIDLFQRCTELANAGHRLTAHDEFETVRDPLFGETVHARYERLFQRIKSSTCDRLAG